MNDIIIAEKYIITNIIGEGAFGTIMEAYHKDTKNKFAIKLEKKSKSSILLHEYNIYKHMGKMMCIPHIKNFGSHGNYRYLIKNGRKY